MPRCHFAHGCGREQRLAGEQTVGAVLASIHVRTKYRLYVCCEGPGHMPDTPCTSPPHEGFEVTVPGTTLRKIAPALRVTSKLLRAAALVGKAAGLPFLPASLPFLNELNAEVCAELCIGCGRAVQSQLFPCHAELSLPGCCDAGHVHRSCRFQPQCGGPC